MYEKDGKYYADWRTREGKRTRKSFTSKRAALKYEEEQKELAHPKTRGRGRQLPKYSAPATAVTPAKRVQKLRLVKH
jgi:hypothetical protein